MGNKNKKRNRSVKFQDDSNKRVKFENEEISKSCGKSKLKKSKKCLSVKSIRKKQLLEANVEEDKAINRLEKLLGLKKRKSKKLPSGFYEDGLAYLLEAVDRKGDETLLTDCSEDMEEDLAVVKGGTVSSERDTKLERPSIFQNKKRTLTDLMKEKGQVLSKDECLNDDDYPDDEDDSNDSTQMDDEDDNDIASEAEEESEEENVSNDETKKTQEQSKLREDIYGRLRDEAGNVIKKSAASNNVYVPPKLRKGTTSQDDQKTEECMRIKRNLKGLMNRLSESNMQNICGQIEDIYSKHSRNDVNQTLFDVIRELLFTSAPTAPRLVMDQAMLISLLHTNIGSEIGAYFLQHIVEMLDELFKSSEDYGEGKQCNNLLIFLSHLYNFKVTHSTLVFDIFHKLVESFKCRDIELIQLLLKNIGFVLRKDDPLKLKELILSIQAKASSFSKKDNDSRIRFMLETLTAIRNNNMYKIPDYDPSIMEHSKKLLKGLIRKGCALQELAISYDDLLNVEERGRWWIVGSAWTENDSSASKGSKSLSGNSMAPKTAVSEKILELARKQHMNTEVRKSIFCILMTAEDFMDAFEKLLKLNLKNQQEREIASVLLHCMLNEKAYNPYYAYLTGKFCSFARKYLMSLQFSLWDRFKDLSQMKPHQLNNLSRFLSHLFIAGSMPLSVLKVIHFSEMSKTMVRFFRQILLAILLHDSEETIEQVFKRISIADNLKLLREGLRLFMHHFLLKNESKLEPDVAAKLKERVKFAENILNSSKHAFKL